jgi:hypothetical protein
MKSEILQLPPWFSKEELGGGGEGRVWCKITKEKPLILPPQPHN